MSDFNANIKLNDNIQQNPKDKFLEGESINQNDTELTSKLQPQTKGTPANPVEQCFKDILCSFFQRDFRNRYIKLNNEFSPHCCDPEFCEKQHKKYNPKKITNLMSPALYNILDNPLHHWDYDLCVAAFCVLGPDRYFSGDVLRILFDYILHGPSEDQMWDVKFILGCQFLEHPPCTEEMREFYIQLLSQSYKGDSYFNTELTGLGVLYHVLNQLEQFYQREVSADITQTSVCDDSMEVDADTSFGSEHVKITFEIMKERWKNHEPLLDEEYNKAMSALDNIAVESMEETDVAPKKRIRLKRLTLALELIVDLLMFDLSICIAKLKRYIKNEHPGTEELVPLIKHFMDFEFNNRIFKLYATTKDKALLRQLSKLIGVMAENVHLFTPPIVRLWEYPDVHHACLIFFRSLSNTICQCEWDEAEKLSRLLMIVPPWLQSLVAMEWINTELNVQMGADLKALVEIIHMHVTSPVKSEKEVKTIKSQHVVANSCSTQLIKNALKRNHYGETRLHMLCKKKGSISELENILALPDIDVNARDNYGWTPLHETVQDGLILKTKLLLKYQPPPGKMPVDIGAQNCKGTTPLHKAVQLGNLKICQLLVDYGGVSLLRKTDFEGITPLELSKTNSEINKYFANVIKLQEIHNQNPDSILNLPEYVIELLIVAFDAYISDHHTAGIDYKMKIDRMYKKVKYEDWIVLDKATLLKFQSDQEQYRKLCRILNNLAKNPKNSQLLRLWNSKFQNLLKVQNHFQPTASSPVVSKNVTDIQYISRIHKKLVNNSKNSLLLRQLGNSKSQNLLEVQNLSQPTASSPVVSKNVTNVQSKSRIHKKLAKDSKNSLLIRRLWNSKLQNMLKVQNLSQPTASSSVVSKNVTAIPNIRRIHKKLVKNPKDSLLIQRLWNSKVQNMLKVQNLSQLIDSVVPMNVADIQNKNRINKKLAKNKNSLLIQQLWNSKFQNLPEPSVSSSVGSKDVTGIQNICRIYKKLAENPTDSSVIRLIDSKFQNLLKVQNFSQPSASSFFVSGDITDIQNIRASRLWLDKQLCKAL